MKAMIRKATALGLAALLGCAALTGCGKGAAIDPSKTLMTVNGEDIRLGVGSFYAKYTQAQIYQFYNMYFGGSNSIFGSVSNEETGETYGDSMKQSALDDVKKMTVISQHAEEYGVSLTDEDNQKIDEAAQAFFDNNDEEIIKKIGAEKEDVVKLLTMQTLQAKMMDPIVKDVDTNVSDEEAQQTTVTYVRIDAETESEAESAESAAESATESAAESTTESATESTAASTAESAAESTAAESEAAEAEETPAQVEAREYAEAVLDAVKAEADIEAADMDAIAKTIDADYYSISGKFTTNDKTDTTLDANIVAAVEGLSDHTLVDHVVRSTDGNTYFVVRLDNNADEAATETKKTSIIRERKQELYDETTDGWVEGAEITVNEDIWKLVTMSDSDPITLKAPEAESTVEEAESAAESVVSAAESAASEAVSAVEEAASEVASAAEEAVSEAASAVEEAASEVASAAEEAVSEAASAVEDAASEAVSAAEEAVSEAASAAESAAN